MLQRLHERLRGVVAWVIVSFVALIFVLFSLDYFLQSHSDTSTVLEVNGVVLSESALNHLYQRVVPAEGAAPSAAEEAALKKQLLTQWASQTVLTQAATKANLIVTTDAAKQLILQLPMFQEKGKFSFEKYQQALLGMRETPSMFLKEFQQKMLLAQQQSGFVDSAFVLASELHRAARFWFETRDFSYLLVPVSTVAAKVPVPEAQIRAYYTAHAKELTTPFQVQVAYVVLSLPAVKAAIHPTDEKMRQYYEENRASLPSTVHSFEEAKAQIREQLINTEAEAQYAKAAEMLSELSYQNPESLAAVSEALHLPIQVSAPFSRTEGSTPLTKLAVVQQAAFSPEVLASHHNSEPIALGENEMAVLRIQQTFPEKALPYEQVKDKITGVLQQQIAKEGLLQAQAEILKGEIPAHLKQLTWQRKTEITREEETIDPEIRQMVFQLTATHPVSAGLLKDGQFVVVRLDHVTEGHFDQLSKRERDTLLKQVSTSLGQVDYELYAKQLMDKSHVKRGA